MKKDQELIVITKKYDLILWSCNHTSKFPRNHRFVLGERIERNLSCSARIRELFPLSESAAKSRSPSRAGYVWLPGRMEPWRGGFGRSSDSNAPPGTVDRRR
jgi:hypothetical protein